MVKSNASAFSCASCVNIIRQITNPLNQCQVNELKFLPMSFHANTLRASILPSRAREGLSSSNDRFTDCASTRSNGEDSTTTKHCFAPTTCNIISVKHSTCTRHDKITVQRIHAEKRKTNVGRSYRVSSQSTNFVISRVSMTIRPVCFYSSDVACDTLLACKSRTNRWITHRCNNSRQAGCTSERRHDILRRFLITHSSAIAFIETSGRPTILSLHFRC